MIMKLFNRLSEGTSLVLILILASTIGPYGHAQASGFWPNEPAGFKVLTDQPFNSPTPNLPLWGSSGVTSIQTDATAPLSPSNVLQFHYPIGYAEGAAPGQWWFSRYGATDELFVGFWWKINSGWQQSSPQIGKIFYLQPSGGGSPNIFWGFTGADQPYGITAQLQEGRGTNGVCNPNCGSHNFFQNVGNANILSGSWYRIEIYVKMSTTKTSQDGVIKTWVNGAQVISYNNVNFDPSVGTFDSVVIVPVYGGTNGTKTQNDVMAFDHWHVSIPGGGSVDSVPPSPPAGLVVR